MTSRQPRRLVGVSVATALIAATSVVVTTSTPASAAPTATGSVTGAGASAATRSGVFRDIDSDGTWDAGEPGQGGITVTATCIEDTGSDPGSFDDVYGPASTTTTAPDGSFSLTGASVRGLCRVEFAIPTDLQTVLQPGVATAQAVAPDSAGSFVQFVDATADPTVTTAVHNPGAYTGAGSTPDVATGIALPGASAAAANSLSPGFDTIVRTDYGLGAPAALAQGDDTGSIWGIAWEPTTETIFAAAVVKRHSGLGTAGPEAIYAVGPNVPAAWATPFTAVDVDGGAVLGDAARGLGEANEPSDDDAAFSQAGTLGWGDLDISEDGRTLYGVNLLSRTVQPIDVATKTAGPAIAIPDPGCTNGNARPWGLEVHDGLLYVGVVCDAETGTADDLAAFVFAHNPTTVTLPVAGGQGSLPAGTWSANLVADTDPAPGIQLDFPKGCTYLSRGCAWNPWLNTYSDAVFNSPSWAAIHPQPILTDIDVDDDGSLLLAFADRVGFQFGYRNVRPQSTNQSPNLEGVAGGDILRAAPTGAGAFALESGGSVPVGAPLGGGTYTGLANSQGPGGGEVYTHENFSTFHFETTVGALAKVPGRSDYLLSIMDPFDTDSGGIGRFPVDGSPRADAIELYDSTAAGGEGLGYGFGKGSGLADIEVLTQLAPVEIGNRVWRDDNANGVQDPGEPPIAGVEVQLAVGAATYTATTDTAGQYLFSSVPRTGATTAPLLAGANYRFDTPDDAAAVTILGATGPSPQTPLVGMSPTVANATGNNAIDSDGVPDGTSVAITLTLGSLTATNDTNAAAGDSVDREGHNRHIFDFGFVPAVSIGNRVWFDTDNDSTLDTGEQPVPGVAVELFHDANANGVIDPSEQVPVAYDTTDGDGLYLFAEYTNPDGTPLATPRPLAPGNYVVGIAASNFAGAGPLVGYHSSGTTIDGAGVIAEAAAPDPDDDVNSDDNGTRRTAGFYAGGVLADPVTVTHGTEPGGEETPAFDNNISSIPDTNSNLTVDFGFYRVAVGNTVWIDDGRGGGDDDDGVQNGGEVGLDGVPVRLYAADGVTQIPVGPDGVLGTADDGPGAVLTSGGGVYSFTGLPEGSYVVQIDAPAGYTSSTDPAVGGTPLAADLDDNGPGTGGGTLTSAVFTLDAGSAADGHVATNPTGTTTNPRVDFGLVVSYDLTIRKTVTSTGPYTAGGPATFSLVASNLGPGVALDGLTVTDRLPAGLTYDVTPATGSEWICAAPVGQEVTCTWEGPTPGLGNDVLASGASAPPITVNAILDTPAPTGVLVNVAVVEPSPDQSIPETIPVGTTPDRYEDGNPGTGSNNDDSGSISTTPVYSLGDLMWVDANRNGQFDSGEAPVVGATVELLDGSGAPALDAFGAPVLPATTDATGRYQFDDLAEGDYQVRFTLPAGAVWTTPNTGADGLDSDAIPTAPDAPTATTATFTLTSTPVPDSDGDPSRRLVTDPTIDAGIVPLVSLGDLVWIDADGDGQFGGTEAPLGGVVVELLTADAGGPALDPFGTPVPSTTTDGNGRYSFEGLLPGDYRVRFTLPSGYVWTVSNTGGDGLDSDPLYGSRLDATATTGVVSLTTISVVDADTDPNRRSVTDPTIDAGVVPLVSLGDLVWVDVDQDGQFDAGEPPIAGVTVTLLDGTGAPALDATGAPVVDTATDADGRYQFDGLVPGEYVVRFTLPSGYAWTTSNVGNDGLDSDATYGSRLDATASTDPFTLSATPVVDADTDPNRRSVTDPTRDAGVVPVVSLGDVVWIDTDRDGVYDAGESPAPLVTVRLLDAVGAGPALGADGLPVPEVSTDADGRYSFENLLPGQYVVEFVLPAGFGWTTPNAGADDGQDSDALAATATAPTARTAVVTLGSPVVDTDPRPSARSVTDPTVDAGIVPVVSLGDVVWIDLDGDGQYNGLEAPLPGATVSLTTAGGATVVDVDGNAVTPVVTDADGRYSFENLPPGDYVVTFDLPPGYRFTSPNQGGDGLDSDAVPATPADTTASTAVITLTPTPVSDADPRPTARDVTDPTVDAGVVPVLSLGDLVWIDEDQNGQYDAGETPLDGVTVRLTDATGAPVTDADGAPVAAATTGLDGRYSFDNLLPGTYRVEFDLPTGYAWTASNVGGDGLDSDAVAASATAPTAVTDPFVLGPVVPDPDPDGLPLTDPTIDAGVVPVLSLGDLVWIDLDQDGIYDAGEQPIAGVTVTLLDGAGNPATDLDGATVPPTATDAGGRYSFQGLLPGDYEVVFTLPAGYRWTDADIGADDSLDSDAAAASPTAPTASTGVITLTSSVVTDNDPDGLPLTDPTLDAGVVPVLSLGDLVWIDLDRDGFYDLTETPVPGVTVRLVDADGDPVTDADGDPVTPTTTDADGRYDFSNLVPGDYRVEFELPPGFVWTTPNTGADDSRDSDAVAATPDAPTALTPVITLDGTTPPDNDPNGLGVTDPTIDAGIVPVLSLGDAVWIDADNDGVYDPTEAPIGGVTVTLLDGSGNPVTDVFGDPVPPVTTDADGRYSFENLPPGDYQVVFTLPPGYAWSPPNQGGDDGLDSDVTPPTRTAPTASTGVFTLSPTPVADTDPNPARRPVTNPTLDAGVVPLVSLGDLVWVDTDGDGALDPGEPPLAGVQVELLDAAGNPARDASGTIVPPTTTDSNGRYSFDDLLPGTYRVRVTLPPDFVWTTPNAGADDSLDSDVVPASPTAPTATTGVITLTPTPVADNDPSPTARDVTDPTVDAGVRPVVSVGDLVWIDDDRDGSFDATERPLPGVRVRLLDAAGVAVRNVTGAIVPETVTDADGRYSFENLLPGQYQIVFVRPDGYGWTVANQGDDGLDSDAVATTPSAVTASTGVFTLTTTRVSDPDGNPAARDVTNPTLDAGLVPLVAVGDYVWRDRDGDGIQDPGEPPVSGVSVTLLDPDGTRAVDADGTTVPVVFTDAAGRYVIDNLLPGSYSIRFGNIPAGFVFTIQGAGGPSDSNPNVTTGQTPVFTIAASDADTRAVTSADGEIAAAFINPTIDAGILDPTTDGFTVTPTTTVPPTTLPLFGLPRTGVELAGTLMTALAALFIGGGLVLLARWRRSPLS